jgi:hypothetical protein
MDLTKKEREFVSAVRVLLQKHSLRTVAQLYSTKKIKVTHADIQRARDGIVSQNNDKRAAFGLPLLALAEICPECERIHPDRRCPLQPTPQRFRLVAQVDEHTYGLVKNWCRLNSTLMADYLRGIVEKDLENK